ncbi:MAG TPA: hypothetical protein VLI93_16605 [Acetobacteraceae bacterium]|nr:hypothetical protein [Acetobacteraceae bacterium]
MTFRSRAFLLRSGALLGCLIGVSGCTSVLSATTANLAGVAAAGISSGVTRNAAVGTGIGLGVAAAADAGLHYVERRVHRAEQDEIATAAGALAPGQVAPWSVRHTLPIEANEHGRVSVFRTVNTPGFTCKDAVFSVESGGDKGTAFYTTTICYDGRQWQWAEAEPATARWGALQ